MPGILTRKIGPFPGWVWGALGGGAFLVFMYMRRRGQSGTQSQGSLVNNPAASSIPYVPNVNVTGVPPFNPPASQPAPLSGSGTLIADSTANPNSATGAAIPTYTVTSPSIQPTTTGLIPNGTQLKPTGRTMTTVWGSGQNTFIEVTWLAGTVWVSQSDVRASTGSGGFGYAGASGYSTPVGGWTVGWQPFGAGGSSTVNRTGAPRPPARLRRLYGGSGGGTAVNRTGARATRPLRRRALSGR